MNLIHKLIRMALQHKHGSRVYSLFSEEAGQDPEKFTTNYFEKKEHRLHLSDLKAFGSFLADATASPFSLIFSPDDTESKVYFVLERHGQNEPFEVETFATDFPKRYSWNSISNFEIALTWEFYPYAGTENEDTSSHISHSSLFLSSEGIFLQF